MAQHYTPIWDDWLKVTQELNDQEKGRLVDAIVAYDNGGNWQERIKGNERYVFPGYQARLDRYNKANAAKTKDKENETEISEISEISESDKKIKKPQILKDKDKDNVIKETPLKGSKEKSLARFAPPTVEEVAQYCRERGNSVNAQTFIDFYSSKGWRVGNTPMKDWKACIRTWEQRDGKPQKPKPMRAQDYEQREYNESEMAKVLGVDDMFTEVAG